MRAAKELSVRGGLHLAGGRQLVHAGLRGLELAPHAGGKLVVGGQARLRSSRPPIQRLDPFQPKLDDVP